MKPARIPGKAAVEQTRTALPRHRQTTDLVATKPLRWPWLTGLTLVAAAWFVSGMWLDVFYLHHFVDNDADRYTAWVYAPRSDVFLVCGGLALVALLPMVLPQVGPRARLAVAATLVLLSVVTLTVGFVVSHDRRDVAGQVRSRLASVHVPGGSLVGGGAGSVQYDGVAAFGLDLALPRYQQTWAVAVTTEASACAAVKSATAGWLALDNECGYGRTQGLVRLSAAPARGTDGSWSVLVTAEPAFS